MAWAPDYVDLDEIREYVRIDSDDDADDAWLELAVSASSRAVDRHTKRQFGRVDEPQARRYWPRWNRLVGAYVLDIDDLMTTEGLMVNDVAVPAPALHPLNAAEVQRPWTMLEVDVEAAPVTVVAQWGWLAVPETIEQVTMLQASRLVKRRDSPFGVAGSPEAGSELRLLARLDPDVSVLIPAYCRKTRPR